MSSLCLTGMLCRGEKCEGCTEKGDYLRLVKKHLPKQIELQNAAAGAAAKGADKKDL